MRGLRRVSRLLAVVALVAATVVVPAGVAQAHALLVNSTPSDGASVETSPDRLVLKFSEPVTVAATTVEVFDSQGVAHRAGPASSSGGKSADEVTVPLPDLAPDRYLVRWRTVSSDDLHLTAGALVFGVGTPVDRATAASAGESPPPLGSLLETTLRWLALLAMGATLGALALAGWLSGQLAGRAESLRLQRVAARAALVGTGALGALGFVAIARVSDASGLSGVLGSGFLVRWLAGVGLLGTLTLVLNRTVDDEPEPDNRAARLVIWTAMAGSVVAVAGLGHTTSGGLLLDAVAGLHLASTLLWVGGVVLLAVLVVPALRRGESAWVGRVVRHFTRLALPALTVSVVTGLLLARSLVPSVGAIGGTAYGRALLVKVGLVALALGLGGATAWLLGQHGGRRLGRRVIVAEALTLGTVVLLAAVLAGTAPPADPRWAASPSQPPTVGLLTEDADDLILTASLGPAVPGANFATIRVLDSRRPALAPINRVLVTVGDAAPIAAVRQGTPCGWPCVEDVDWVVSTSAITQSGPWPITVDVERTGFPTVRRTFVWNVAPAPGQEQGGAALSGPLGWLAAVALATGVAAMLLVVRGRRRTESEQPTVPAKMDELAPF